MDEPISQTQRRHPNMVGAGLVAGILTGLAIGGAFDNFGLWVPLTGVVGLLAGMLLHASSGERAS